MSSLGLDRLQESTVLQQLLVGQAGVEWGLIWPTQIDITYPGCEFSSANRGSSLKQGPPTFINHLDVE